ncbi:unnamed protein product [Blepharisma stoltei]|uniref:Gustatory receptor n=1 Tax=Blepharisma stoltei TaxID=1481888 RepID=A0AAU9IQV5_9CILI|nr:unnamed protein product [Blepharisma stoltei]
MGIEESQVFWVFLILHIVGILLAIWSTTRRTKRVGVDGHVKRRTIRMDTINLAKISGKRKKKKATVQEIHRNYFYVYYLALKQCHALFEIFFRELEGKERAHVCIAYFINLLGVLGISGAFIKAELNYFIAGGVSMILARLMHALYFSLQKKEKPLKVRYNTDDEMAKQIETVVVQRLIRHRETKEKLGYMLMILYYVGNFYYCIDFLVSLNSDQKWTWFLCVVMGFVFDTFVIEFVRIGAQLCALIILSRGDMSNLEPLLLFILTEQFINLFE